MKFLVVLSAIIIAVVLNFTSNVPCNEWPAKDKVILITGASSGIGEETAYSYARSGAKLVLTARKAGELAAVTERCRSLGANDVLAIPVEDIALQAENERLVNEAIAKFGSLDLLVLNAGISMGAFFEDVKVRQCAFTVYKCSHAHRARISRFSSV